MKVQIERSFSLPGSVEAAWTVLSDIERVAGCMPGASITERVADDRYKGAIAVKFGPASLSFRGEVTVLAVDPATWTVRLAGKGTDSTGSSGASMDLTARIEPEGASSRLQGTSEVMVSGKAAAFGSRMMSSVAEQVLKQFGDTFATQVHTAQTQVQARAAAAPAYVQEPPPTPAMAAPGRQLNAIALAWAVFKDWLRSLFTAKRA